MSDLQDELKLQEKMMKDILENSKGIQKNFDIMNSDDFGSDQPDTLEQMMLDQEYQRKQAQASVKLTAKSKEAEKTQTTNVATYKVQMNTLQKDKNLKDPDGEGQPKPKGFFAKIKSTFKGSDANGKQKTKEKKK